MFSDCTNLQSVIIPGSVDKVGYKAFANCSALSKIIIEDGVLSVDRYAFSGCTKLQQAAFKGNSTNIENANAFEKCSNLTIYAYNNSSAENFARENSIAFSNNVSEVKIDAGSAVLKGDINGDGSITTKDATLALQMSTGKRTPDLIADVNNDGSVTTKDAVAILRYSTGKILNW